MSLVRSLLCCLVGATATTGLILACNDRTPAADAGIVMPDASRSCDCPPAEPPLAGRIVQRQYKEDFGMDGWSVISGCKEIARDPNGLPIDGILLGGKCEIRLTMGKAALVTAGGCEGYFSDHPDYAVLSYCCRVNDDHSSEEGRKGTLIATAICLIPASPSSVQDAGH